VNPFTSILVILDTIAQMAVLIPGAQIPAGWADSLLQIAIRTNNMHNSLFGKQLDLDSLKDYVPRPLPTAPAAPQG